MTMVEAMLSEVRELAIEECGFNDPATFRVNCYKSLLAKSDDEIFDRIYQSIFFSDSERKLLPQYRRTVIDTYRRAMKDEIDFLTDNDEMR